MSVQIIEEIFIKTEELLEGRWCSMENDQMSHILYYLSLTACYLKSKKEAEVFKEHWLKIKETIKDSSDFSDFMNQHRMMEDHVEQALKEESVHHPNRLDNPGIKHFFDNQFASLYKGAIEAKNEFQKRMDSVVKERQEYVKRLENDSAFFDAEWKAGRNPWQYLD